MTDTDQEQEQTSQPEAPSEGDSSRWSEDEGPRLNDSDIEDVTQTYPEKQS